MDRERQAQGGETRRPTLCQGALFNLHMLKDRLPMSSFDKPGQKLREVTCSPKNTQHGPCLELELSLRPKHMLFLS